MNDPTFAVPADNRYFEDYVASAVHELGPIEVEEAKMIAVASIDEIGRGS